MPMSEQWSTKEVIGILFLKSWPRALSVYKGCPGTQSNGIHVLRQEGDMSVIADT